MGLECAKISTQTKLNTFLLVPVIFLCMLFFLPHISNFSKESGETDIMSSTDGQVFGVLGL